MEPATNNHWQIRDLIPESVSKRLEGFSPILKQMLFNRDCSTAEQATAYLSARSVQSTDPFGLAGMETAATRVLGAIDAGEPVVIYGDYDVDGVTATALLFEVIRTLGGDVRPYIPNRYDEGYGLNNEALTLLAQEGAHLVVTVDCGIRSMKEAAHARSLGIDLIITDHHQPLEEIPDALAVICPKQPGDTYPEKYLAGVGLAYKLAQALFERRPGAGISADNWLDLVALGTVADLAPLVGENRVLVRAGLGRMRMQTRQGLLSLAGAAGIDLTKVTATDIGFRLGPRLNAAGRLDSALAAFDLLTTKDLFRAGELAQQLNVQNSERRKQTEETQTKAEVLALAENPEAMLIFAVSPEFSEGIVGLAASHLADQYYRPAIVAVQGAETTRGSCRSIPEFNITAALDECKDLLVRHGGHAAAAGFTVRNENLKELQDQLQKIAVRELDSRRLQRILVADIEIPLTDLRPEILSTLDLLQPTGYGNPDAIFVSRNLSVNRARTVGADQQHLKLTVTDGVTFDAIAFKQGRWVGMLPPKVDLMYTFERNDFNGRTSFQLNVRDLKPSGLPD